jgi:hypothetical protein
MWSTAECVVKVLVCHPAQELPLAAAQQAGTEAVRRPSGFDRLLNGIRGLATPGEVFIEFGGMAPMNPD